MYKILKSVDSFRLDFILLMEDSTGMHHITTFRSAMDRIYDGGPVIIIIIIIIIIMIIPLCYNCLQYSVQQHAVQVCSLGATGYTI